jgi:RNA polymerase sigma factor (sigma-70 family)
MRSAGQGGRPPAEHAKREEPRGQSVPAETPVLSQPGVDAGPPAIAPVGVPLQPDPQSTVELTIRAQAGDQAALEALCLRCLKSLTRYAAGRLPPAARGMVETQDVVLEAVQRGMFRLHEFEVRHPGALVAYMRTILRNLIVDYARTAVRRPLQVSLDEHQADRGKSPLECVLDEEQIQLYEAAVERLKPRDAALVTLKIDEQLGYEEIAVELGFRSANAARVATRRAVLRLAHEMSRLKSTISNAEAANSAADVTRDDA